MGLAALAMVLGGPGPAHASCVVPPPLDQALEQAEIVFVGTVVAIDDGGRAARFDVEEVWRGTVPDEVVVRGGPEAGPPGIITSVDRLYQPGTRYLVVPTGAEGGALTDNLCTSTQEWDDSLAAFRPADAYEPEATEDAAQPTASVPWLPLGLGGVATLAVIAVARIRRPVTADDHSH